MEQRRKKTAPIGKPYTKNEQLITYLKDNSYYQTAKELVEYTSKNIPDCENIKEADIRRLLRFYGCDYKKIRTNSYKQMIDDFIKMDTSEMYLRNLYQVAVSQYKYPHKQPVLRKLLNDYRVPYKEYSTRQKYKGATTYTKPVLEYLKNLNTEEMTTTEILENLKQTFPDKKFIMSTLRNKLNIEGISYRKVNVSKKEKIKPIPVEVVNTEIKPIEPEVIKEEYDTPNYINDLSEEIATVTQNKFKELGCEVGRDYTTDEYIKTLKMLEYLCKNKENIIRNRINQHDIMTNYTEDILHESELSSMNVTDTYIQNKLHIVRVVRRKYEYDSQDLNIMKGFLNSIDLKKLSNTIYTLEQEQERRKNQKYIPNVDNTLLSKYDWAFQGTDKHDKTYKTILKTTEAMDNNDKLYVYRATCELCGGNYKAYTKWYHDFRADSRDDALVQAKKYLATIVRKGKANGVYYSNLQVVQLPR